MARPREGSPRVPPHCHWQEVTVRWRPPCHEVMRS
jgi:hypothetical protein